MRKPPRPKPAQPKVEQMKYTSEDDEVYLSGIFAGHSAVDKSCIAIVSAIFVFFPSTYTFIHPPFFYDYLLVVSVLFGSFGFLFAAMSLYVAEYSGNPHEFARLRRSKKLSEWAAILTAAFLVSVFIYVIANALEDYSSSPEITSIRRNPLSPVAGDVVEFSGQAHDQDLEPISWSWSIERLRPRSEIPASQLGDLDVAYWRATAGDWRIIVSATDSSGHRSAEESITFSVGERPRP